MEAIQTIDRLIYNLNMGPGYEGFIELVKAIKLKSEELDRICGFKPEAYQRIRIYDTPSLEALISCWERGQKGPIHNYDFHQAWLKVLKGSLRLTYFQWGNGEMNQITSQTLKKGEIAMINDGLGFHQFECEGDENTIAIHLYSDKVESWQVFNTEKNEIENSKVHCDRNLDL